MRKITADAVDAFNNEMNFKRANTEVEHDTRTGTTYLKLHGNTIARKRAGRLMVTNCGWFTNTTKERLNGLPNVSIHQKNHVWYLNGKEWNGNLTVVK